MSPDVYKVNNSLPRGSISELGDLKIVDDNRFFRWLKVEPDLVEGDTLICPEGLRGIRETIATTTTMYVCINAADPFYFNREGMMPSIKLVMINVGVMFVTVNHRLNFFYFASPRSDIHKRFQADYRYENFNSIKEAMDAYNVYEIVEEL